MAEEGIPGIQVGARDQVEAEESQKAMDEGELRRVFDQFDSDKSGAIDVKELQDAMRMLGVKCSANSAKRVLAAIDKDGNGTVEWEICWCVFRRCSSSVPTLSAKTCSS